MALRHQLTNLSFRLVRTWSVIISENAKPNKDKINTESIPSTDWSSIALTSYLIEHKPIQNRSFLSFKIPIQLIFEAKFKNSLKKSPFSSYRCEDVFTNPINIIVICVNFASNSRQNQNSRQIKTTEYFKWGRTQWKKYAKDYSYLSKMRGTAHKMVGLIKATSPLHPFFTFVDMSVIVKGDENPT